MWYSGETISSYGRVGLGDEFRMWDRVSASRGPKHAEIPMAWIIIVDLHSSKLPPIRIESWMQRWLPSILATDCKFNIVRRSFQSVRISQARVGEILLSGEKMWSWTSLTSELDQCPYTTFDLGVEVVTWMCCIPCQDSLLCSLVLYFQVK